MSGHKTFSSSLHLSPSTLKASSTAQRRVERNFRKAKNTVNRELVAFLTETTNALSRLEEPLSDEDAWHVDNAMGVAQRCIQEPLERFKESVKDEVDEVEELRRSLDAGSTFCKRLYAKLLFVLSHCSRLMATREENSPGIAGTPACFTAARTRRERRSSGKGKKDRGSGRSGGGGSGLRAAAGNQSRGRGFSFQQQQHASEGRVGKPKRSASQSPGSNLSPSSSPSPSPRPSLSSGHSPSCTPIIMQLQELHLLGSDDGSSRRDRDLRIPELPIPAITTLTNAHYQHQTPSTPPSSGGLPRYVIRLH